MQRRQFLKLVPVLTALPQCLLAFCKHASSYSKVSNPPQDRVGGPCDGCDIMYKNMPKSLSNVSTLPDWNEPGQKMIVEGKVLKADGKNPAEGVIIYFYHTDHRGYYSPKLGDNKDVEHGH